MRSLALISCFLAVGSGIGCGANAAAIDPPTGPAVVVANQDDGVATLVDLTSGRVLGHIDVGMDPHEAAVSPDGRTVALASPSKWYGSANRVALVDAATATHLKTIDLGDHYWPHGVAFLDARTLLVGTRDSAAVLSIDVESGRLTHAIDNGGAGPYLLHLVKTTSRAYTSNPMDNVVTELDLTTRQLRRKWDIRDGPAGFNVSPTGESLWVATGTDQPPAITVVDLGTGGAIARLAGFSHPRRIAFSRDGSIALITDGDDLRVFDARARQERGRVALGSDAGASGVTFGPTATVCYVAASGAGAVFEIDLERLTVRRTFMVGEGADGIAYAPLKAVP